MSLPFLFLVFTTTFLSAALSATLSAALSATLSTTNRAEKTSLNVAEIGSIENKSFRACSLEAKCVGGSLVSWSLPSTFSDRENRLADPPRAKEDPNNVESQFGSNPKNSNQELEIGTIFRWTKNGWEDSSRWFQQSASVQSRFDQLHPVVWSGIVLGLVMLVLVIFSKEAEIDRWFGAFDQVLGNKEE